MKRIWIHFQEWEEITAGMWNDKADISNQAMQSKVFDFMNDVEAFKAAMFRVASEWEKSCLHNLTALEQNRLAWIGHAACALILGCPEHITRKAWGTMSQEKQDAGNASATEAVQWWESNHAKKNSALHSEVEAAGIRKRTTRTSAVEAGGTMQGAVLSGDCSSDSNQRHSLCQPWLFQALFGGLHEFKAD